MKNNLLAIYAKPIIGLRGLSWWGRSCLGFALIVSVAVSADAQTFTKDPIGFDTTDRNMVDPVGSQRDERGNLTKASIADIDTGATITCGVGATAYGNLISVVIDGSGNSVVIDAIQTNSGNIAANTNVFTGAGGGC